MNTDKISHLPADHFLENLEDLPVVNRLLLELDEMERYQDEWMKRLTD